MKKMGIYLFVFCLFSFPLRAQIIYQSIYEIKFSASNNANGQYTALIIYNSDGKNEIRLKFFNSRTKQNTVFEIPFYNDSISFFNFKGISPKLIFGNDKDALRYIYFKNLINNNEPLQIAVAKKFNFYERENVTSVKNIYREDMQPAYLKQFFLPDEFYFKDVFYHNKNSKKIFESMPQLYLLSIANTKDAIIGDACQKDANSLLFVLNHIANDLNMPLHLNKILGDIFNKQNVLNLINNIHPHKNDIVFFYYTGHGFSYKNDTAHIYPQLALFNNPPAKYSSEYLDKTTINIEEVYEMIKKKNGRLNIVLSDCCNSLIEFYRYFPNNIAASEGYMEPINYEVASTLFFKTKASILVTAAAKVQIPIKLTTSYRSKLTT